MKSWGEEHQLFTDHLVFGKTILACLFGRRYGPVQTATPLQFLTFPRIPVGGDEYTVNVAHAAELAGTAYFQVSDGPSYRHILDFSDLENSRFIHPMGQSGNILSPHYDDLLQTWGVRICAVQAICFRLPFFFFVFRICNIWLCKH